MPDSLLAGLRVVDFSTLLPGPFATLTLASLGADVIKVERPKTGDPVRDLMPGFFDAANRGKRSIAIDLKHSAARDVVLRLAAWADVVVEGFRPGVAARLGIDAERLMAHNSRLVYCSISGYGTVGPYRNLPGHELNFLGVAGALDTSVGEDRFQLGTTVPAGDTLAGLYAAVTVVSAVARSARTGVGAHLETSILASTLSAMAPLLAEAHAKVEDGFVRPAQGVFRASDGASLSVSATEDVFWQRLCLALGLDDLGEDVELATWAGRARRADEIEDRLRAAFAKRRRAEWLRVLEAADVPGGPVNDPTEVEQDPHVKAGGQIWRTPEGQQVVGFPALVDGNRPAPVSAAPAIGEHSAEVLALLGYDVPAQAELAQSGAVGGHLDSVPSPPITSSSLTD